MLLDGRGSQEPRPAARERTTNRKETDATAVGSLYVGGMLFVNAVVLLGKAESRNVGIFNPFVVSCR